MDLHPHLYSVQYDAYQYSGYQPSEQIIQESQEQQQPRQQVDYTLQYEGYQPQAYTDF